VKSSLEYCLTEGKWNIMDEIQLIEAINTWKFGNWNYILEQMDYNGSPFPQEEIEKHYQDYYETIDPNKFKSTKELVKAEAKSYRSKATHSLNVVKKESR